MLADPGRVIQEIERWSGLDLAKTRRKLTGKEAFYAGHLVTGNRLRKHGEIQFDSQVRQIVPKNIIVKLVLVVMNLWQRVLGF